jgi:hypothetical protein
VTVTDMAAYRSMSDAEKRAAAHRDALADPTITGKELGERYGMSDGWGRKRARLARTGPKAVPVRKATVPPQPVYGPPVPEAEPAAQPEPAAPVPASEPAPRRRIDPLVVITVVAVAVVAVVALVVSYSHTHDLALLAGQSELLARILPAAVDGLVVAGSTSLLVDHRAGRKGDQLAGVAVVVGLASSVAANVAAADPGAVDLRVVRLVMAAYAPIALAISGHLLLRMLGHTDRRDTP